jgi:hypothetical protein
MKTLVLATLALLGAGPAGAADVAGWLQGGVGVVFREPSDDPPFDQLDLEYDTGTQLHLDIASHYGNGLLLRAGYAYTLYDEFTALGGLAIEKDIEQHEVRAGAFFAPRRAGLRYRVGGGYAYFGEDVDTPAASRQQDGGFIEAGLSFDATPRLTLDFALAVLKVGGDADHDAEAAELRAGAILHTGTIDLVAGVRYASFTREGPTDEELIELRLGLGGAWAFPENR